jgi:tetratricopeptide (TPR) repeat protein
VDCQVCLPRGAILAFVYWWSSTQRNNRCSVIGEMDGRITIRLHGPFDVRSPDRQDLTPPSAKAQAILALLASASQFRRPRTWLQDQLWSRRAPKQASGSLRQALLEIRRSLGPFATLLRASRSAVQLDPDRVCVEELEAGPQGETEFLLGLQARDPAFETWLRDMRGKRSALPPARSPAVAFRGPGELRAARRPTVLVQLDSFDRPDARNMGLFVLDLACRSLSELHDFAVIRSDGAGTMTAASVKATLLVQIQTVEGQGGSIGLRTSVEDCATLRTFWSNFARMDVTIQPFEDSFQGLSVVQGIVQAVSDVVARQQLICLPGEQYDASVLAASAMRKMFSMRHSELQAAQQLLNQALEVSPRGLYHAWRAQLAIIRLIEKQSDDTKALREQTEEDIAHALEAEPVNSNVLAAAANARIVFDYDFDSSLVLARHSIASNKANPLGWWSLANALLYSGDAASAYEAAVTAQNLADKTSLKAWADFQRSLTAAATGRIEEATAFGASSHAMAPHFRPPLRYLIALYARSGTTASCARSVRRLQALENDFSIDRLISDREYPASILHRAHLIDRVGLEKSLEASTPEV